MDTTTAAQTIGTRPVGTATGTERWVTVHNDNEDGRTVVTGYVGWLESSSVKIDGNPRTRAVLADVVAAAMYADLTA